MGRNAMSQFCMKHLWRTIQNSKFDFIPSLNFTIQGFNWHEPEPGGGYWLGVKRWQLCLRDTSHSAKCLQPIWPIWPNFEVNGLDWQCCLAGSSKTAPRIFIFSIVLGAEYLSYVKSIETHARAFLPLNISAVGSVI